MRTIFSIVLIAVVGIGGAAGRNNRFVDLDRPGALEEVARNNPEHHGKILDLIRVAETLPCELMPQVLHADFKVNDVMCGPVLWKTSDPPKRTLSFNLDGTKYVAVVALTGTRPRRMPA